VGCLGDSLTDNKVGIVSDSDFRTVLNQYLGDNGEAFNVGATMVGDGCYNTNNDFAAWITGQYGVVKSPGYGSYKVRITALSGTVKIIGIVCEQHNGRGIVLHKHSRLLPRSK
jgi:hypothetical protein